MDVLQQAVSEPERKRIEDLLRLILLIYNKEHNALDIGAREGIFSLHLAEHYQSVTALDLEKPSIVHDKVHCVKGDLTALNFGDNSFDLVFCTEVLEHIPPHLLQRACSELSRVSRHYLIIGVPYKQDIRVGRVLCRSCGRISPPWGHVNSFDETRLLSLFPSYQVREQSFVGETNAYTNFLSVLLTDLAGNPYGSYNQKESCMYCGEKVTPPTKRSFLSRILMRMALYINYLLKPFYKPHPNWIHLLLEKKEGSQ